MKHIIAPLLLAIMQVLPVSAQNTITHTVRVELYAIDMLVAYKDGGDRYMLYSGQSARYVVSKTFPKGFSLGMETGVFFHARNGEQRWSYHAYIPLQLTARAETMNRRLAVALSMGYPLLLTSRDNYTGSGGLWYKNIRPNPVLENDEQFHSAQDRIVDQYYLVSNLRLEFSLSRLNNWYANVGLQHYWFNSHIYSGGSYYGPYSSSKGFCVNFSCGLSYHFGNRKTEW